MPGFIGSPHFEPSRFNISGSASISGSLFISGSLTVYGTSSFSGSTYVSGTFAVSGTDGTKITGVVSETTAVCHYYADATIGDDTYNGLSAAFPKKSIRAAEKLLPDYILHNTCLHLSGNFAEFDSTQITRTVLSGNMLLIDGGSDLVVVDNNSNADFTSTATAVGSITQVAVVWVADALAGYWIEIIDGVAAGQTRVIQGNTTDTITPIQNWTADPGIGSKFRIMCPSTTLSSDYANGSTLYIGQTNSQYGSSVKLQRIYMSGTRSRVATYSGYGAQIAGIVNNSSYAPSFSSSGGIFSFTPNITDPATFTSISLIRLGVSQINASSSVQINGDYVYAASLLITNVYFYSCYMSFCDNFIIFTGTRIKSLFLYNCGTLRNTNNFTNTTNFATTKLGGGAIGLSLFDSTVMIGNIDISNCTTHGISANHSFVIFSGVTTGTTNTKFGLYAYNNSTINTNAGLPPTLTGTSGDISTDGVNQLTTFAIVDAIHKVVDLNEGVIVKQILI